MRHNSGSGTTMRVVLTLAILYDWAAGLRSRAQIDQCLAIRHHRTVPTLDECYLVPDYTVNYYYTSLQEKFVEVMSVNNCSAVSTTGEALLGYEPRTGERPDLEVRVIPPPAFVTQRWGTYAHERHNQTRLTFRVNEELCKSDLFAGFKRGNYKDAKGCGQMMQFDRNISNKGGGF